MGEAPKKIRTNAAGNAIVTPHPVWDTDVEYIRADVALAEIGAARVLLDAMPKITAKPLAEMADAMKIDAHPAILLRGLCAALRAIAEGKDEPSSNP